MKHYLFIFLLFSFIGTGQHKISGTILDAKNNPVEFAAISLLKQQDSVFYKSTQTNEKGFFEITHAEKEKYILKISSYGHSEKYLNIDVQSDLQLTPILLEQNAEILNDVTITTSKPILKRKIDRIEFTVENSSLSTNNAWEILGKTPGVTTMSSGNLIVRGSNSILVTINDKKVYLTGDELKQFLENTNGEDVKSIEVITNPPAKYEAQGATVLNIRLKKNIKLGYKGTVSSSYTQSIYAKGNISTSHIYKGEKLSLSGRYTFGTGTYVREGEDFIHYLDNSGETNSIWESILKRKNKSASQNSFRVGSEYEIDNSNTLSFGITGSINPNVHGFYNVPTYIYDRNRNLDSLYVTQNNREKTSRNNDYNFSYDHKFKEKEKLSFSSDYTHYYYNENQDIFSSFSLPNNPPYRQTRFVSDNTQKIQLFSAQSDYANEDNGIEMGMKFGKVKADSQLIFKDEINGELIENTSRTNQFLYDETIFAGYASYNKEIEKWTLKAGLRGEYTQLKGNSVTVTEINQQKYFKLFPTFYALYKANENHQIGFSYGKRISRPQYSWLNPFRSYYNSYSYFVGDPKLQPTIIHNLNLTYTLKDKYNFDLYYRHEKNPSMEISYQDYETTTVVYHLTNIEKNTALGLEFNANLVFFDWWESGIQAGINYTQDTFLGVDEKLYQNKRLQYNGSTNNRFTFNKKKDFTAEVNFYYNSKSVQGTFTISQSTSLDFAFRKKIFQDRWELFAIFSDVYRGEKQTVITKYANQYNYFTDYSDTQSFKIGFKYNFGNQKLNEKNRTQTEEQKRI
ncbi:TonB-dependent receptor domain-containing protein [Flavobacterium gyeonganense]|uniref:TonB-dependent receptor domain-containing protein n=1 Tax=Flavobacterium gyeonganense TaxID=1310418 RepID=A0ABV5HF54_9FLAO